LAKKANCRARFLSRERKLGKESGLSRTPRWACLIDAFEKSFAKPQWSNTRWVFLFDALCGMFNTRVRGGCRRARSPHANVLCEHFHASKADATNVARMSGGRAISRERPERVPTALAPGAQAQ